MSPLLNALAASSYIDTVKARAKSAMGHPQRIGLAVGTWLICTYDPPSSCDDIDELPFPELCWCWELSSKTSHQLLTEGEAQRALQGEMPKAAMSGEAVFARIARNSENVRG